MTTIDIFKNRGDFCDLLIKKYNLKHCKIVKKFDSINFCYVAQIQGFVKYQSNYIEPDFCIDIPNLISIHVINNVFGDLSFKIKKKIIEHV